MILFLPKLTIENVLNWNQNTKNRRKQLSAGINRPKKHYCSLPSTSSKIVLFSMKHNQIER